jgi:hypothetical protein
MNSKKPRSHGATEDAAGEIARRKREITGMREIGGMKAESISSSPISRIAVFSLFPNVFNQNNPSTATHVTFVTSMDIRPLFLTCAECRSDEKRDHKFPSFARMLESGGQTGLLRWISSRQEPMSPMDVKKESV